MARALCELQAELADGWNSENIVKHPSKKGLKRNRFARKQSKVNKCVDENGENIVKHQKKKGLKRKKFTRKQSRVNNCVDESYSNSQLLESNNIKVKTLGNFPSSKELVTLTKGYLEKRCKLGYRARRIFELAERVEEGKLKLEFEKTSSYEEIFNKLSKIKGFGPYASATLMMCIGFYQTVPMDTETKRHLQQVLRVLMLVASCKYAIKL